MFLSHRNVSLASPLSDVASLTLFWLLCPLDVFSILFLSPSLCLSVFGVSSDSTWLDHVVFLFFIHSARVYLLPGVFDHLHILLLLERFICGILLFAVSIFFSLSDSLMCVYYLPFSSKEDSPLSAFIFFN